MEKAELRELNVNELTGGSKLMNILRKSLPEAKDSFFYKMLRKKNITLNNKKATGSEIVSTGDVIKFFLSDETYDKFAGKASKAVVCNGKANGNRADDSGAGADKLNHGSVAQVVGRNVKPNVINGNATDGAKKSVNNGTSNSAANATAKGTGKSSSAKTFKINKNDIAYEDKDIILINKPYGILSQKAEPGDYSMVEALYDYMLENGMLSADDIFRPAVTNRLDRNTTGIIAGGKTTSGLQFLSNAQKNGDIKKFYICIVPGEVKETRLLNGLWSKNTRNNRVTIEMVENIPGSYSFPSRYWTKGNVPAQTLIAPVVTNGRYTVVKIGLLTGKSHQIRAHMKAYGHPLIGDFKYGQRNVNDYFARKYGLTSQLLHAYMMDIEGKGEFVAKLPKQFINILKGEGLYSDSIEEIYKNIELKP